MLSPQRCHGKPLEGLLQPFKTAAPTQERKCNVPSRCKADTAQSHSTYQGIATLEHVFEVAPYAYKPQVLKDIHTIYFTDDMSSLSSSP